MATTTEILDVRNNTNTTTEQYSDVIIGGLIDDSSINCASATIWRWELSKLGTVASGLKKSSAGVESHEYQSISDQMNYYDKMYNMYSNLCKQENGVGVVRMIKVEQPNVGGVVTEDQINEYLS